MTSLSVAFCTRNREADLEKAIRSVLVQAPVAGVEFVELLIVDDGCLPEAYLESVKARCDAARWRFRYHNKSARGGLYKSRLESFAEAAGDVVTFFDDDVEVEAGYLDRVVQHFAADPDLAGLGGIDTLQVRTPLWRVLYEIAIGFRSLSAGRLSWSTYGGAMDWWSGRREPFDCDFLYGCNMSYRRRAMGDMRPVPLFEGHSSAEDLYLTWWARRSGATRVDPHLRVQHHQSPVARDRMEAVFFRQVVNHAGLVSLTGRAGLCRLLVLYTAAGLVLLASLKLLVRAATGRGLASWGQVLGGLRGIGHVLKVRA